MLLLVSPGLTHRSAGPCQVARVWLVSDDSGQSGLSLSSRVFHPSVGLPELAHVAAGLPLFPKERATVHPASGGRLRTCPASLPPPSSDQSQPQLQPRFKRQENLHLLMEGAVESRDKRGGFSGRGITVIIWWSSSDSLGGCSMKTKTHYNLHV